MRMRSKSELSDTDKALVRRMVRGAVANAVASEGKDLREARLPYGDMTVQDLRCVLPRHRAGFAER